MHILHFANTPKITSNHGFVLLYMISDFILGNFFYQNNYEIKLSGTIVAFIYSLLLSFFIPFSVIFSKARNFYDWICWERIILYTFAVSFDLDALPDIIDNELEISFSSAPVFFVIKSFSCNVAKVSSNLSRIGGISPFRCDVSCLAGISVIGCDVTWIWGKEWTGTSY